MSPPHATNSGMRGPVRPYVGTNQTTGSADEPGLNLQEHSVIPQPVAVELGTVMAPAGRAVDEQVPAAMGANMPHSHWLR